MAPDPMIFRDSADAIGDDAALAGRRHAAG
jgi:hypothetical protein